MKLQRSIIVNATIYPTCDPGVKATAMAIQGERILAIGSNEEVLAIRQPTDTIQNLGGKVILPGLTDAHLHLEHYALGLQKVECETATRAECLRRVAERAHQTPAGEWVLGYGWNQNIWPEGFGSTSDLDAVAAQQPIYLTAKSLHAAWANSAALRLAGIQAATPDPQGGRIGRDAQGNPDGILYESAMSLVEGAIPAPTVEQVAQAVRQAQPILWRMGITGVHDYDRRRCFAALQLLHAHGDLRLRVVKSIPLDDLPHAVSVGLRSGFGDDWLRIGSVKAFADGALGPQTAAMLQPYRDQPENRGMLLLDAEELAERGRLAVENGLSLAVHAIGDRANHEVLDGFARLRTYERSLGAAAALLRHRIEHVQVLHVQDAARLAELGIIASMQPIHATSDMLMADRYWGERCELAYAWRTQLQAGATLAFGSDAPVESPNPFWGLYAATTRRRADGTPDIQGWYPRQRLTMQEALSAFTSGPALAAGMERRLGKLLPGYLADLIILEQDPFNVEAECLLTLQPQATMVAGEWVFREGR